MNLPPKFRRSVSLAIPLLTGLLFFGIIESIFDVNALTNLFQTGVSLGFIFGILNIFLFYLVYKHRVP